ncbi:MULTISPECIES: hypothetical protein [Vibrio]|uniref:Uncharacterized protein n=1 Tax=Vibrio mediterranei TaxID=689 RepID=A0A2S9ZQM9_9VIBR|nr:MULTISPECIES: hypothetical protein [Vibrio]AYV23994.1 hypothetical protein ECB94_22235 [Vibrio mediterranei]MCF4173579.1 hypothetical protein [Vibrio sp. McD22-P3]MCG9661120.1 hypothetical protein [Vibrio mediterranei]MCG9663245.1 hypothetical protein [Vibrio mediterranei]MCY9852528.1 hypothetical protein [Vibrio mediterranei]
MKKTTMILATFIPSLAIACGAHVHNTLPHYENYTESLVAMSVCKVNEHISEQQSAVWFKKLAWVANGTDEELFEHYAHFAAEHVSNIANDPDMLPKWNASYCKDQFFDVMEMDQVVLEDLYDEQELADREFNRQIKESGLSG